MSNKYSLHIGIQKYSGYYLESVNRLKHCHDDAKKMCGIAKELGFIQTTPHPLIDSDATLENIQKQISAIAKKMNNEGGGIFMFTFAGHGCQILDDNKDEITNNNQQNLGMDNNDERICLYDKVMYDDRIKTEFSRFENNTKIISFFDSCHSGTVASLVPVNFNCRGLTDQEMNYLKSKNQTKKELAPFNNLIGIGPKIKAPWISYSACDDQSQAYENHGNGYFTRAVNNAFRKRRQNMGYLDFFNSIVSELKADPLKEYDQSPFLYYSEGFNLAESIF